MPTETVILQHLPPGAFARADESDDSEFYSRNRFVEHLDSQALATVEMLIGHLAGEDEPAILDLMASWDSHLPADIRPSRLVGLGLNEAELQANERLSEYVIHDLNANPALPFPDGTFHAVLCTVSVDYMTRPVETFRDVARILKPGGVFAVIFSNRYFPQKVVEVWKQLTEDERVFLVQDYFRQSGAFADTRVYISRGKPRPADDKYAALGLPGDPVYAVFAEKPAAVSHEERPLPDSHAVFLPDHDEVKRRMSKVGQTHRCPYCESELKKWHVPQHIYTEWPNEFFYVCFNDECPYYIRGWETMALQKNPGSYRLKYDPLTGACGPIPVFDKNTLRDGMENEPKGA